MDEIVHCNRGRSVTLSPMRLATRTDLIPPFHAMEFAKKAAALEARGVDVIRMSIGEPDFAVPPRVVAAMREAASVGRTTYTPALGLPALREAIAEHQGRAFGAEVDPGRIVVTAGASAALMLVAAALVEPGDEVLVADPSYPCNRRFIEAFGGRARLVETTPATRWQLDATLVEAHWGERTRGVMVASPSNPSGTSVPFDELGRLFGAVAERGGWRLVDEIYLGLSHAGTPRSILSIDPDAIAIGSFSKYFAMTGWRLGWAIVPAGMVEAIERLAQNLYICASTPAQHAALECFHPETLALCEARRQELGARRERVLAGLAAAGWQVPVPPDGAFYVYLDTSEFDLDSAALAADVLERAHVSLTPGIDFGEAGAATHLRLSYATSADEIDRAVEALARFRERFAG